MRVLVLVGATIGVIAAGAYVSGGPSAANGAPSAAFASIADRSGDSAEAAPLRGKKRKRPGCRRFCQQAGGFGAGDEMEVWPVDVPLQIIAPPRNRVIRLTATCNLDTECVGAIIVDSLKLEYGRADLEIPAHVTETVKVGISRKALDYLKKKGDRRVFATVPLKSDDPVSFSDKLTLLAPG